MPACAVVDPSTKEVLVEGMWNDSGDSGTALVIFRFNIIFDPNKKTSYNVPDLNSFPDLVFILYGEDAVNPEMKIGKIIARKIDTSHPGTQFGMLFVQTLSNFEYLKYKREEKAS